MKTEQLLGKIGKYAMIGLAVGILGTGAFTWLNDGQFGEVIMGEKDAVPFEEQRTLPGQNITKFAIKSGNTDVEVKPGTGNDVQVQLRGIGNVDHLLQKNNFIVEQQGDTAHIEFVQTNNSLTRKFFRFQTSTSLTLEVFVPQKMYDELQVEMLAGDISVRDFQAKKLGLESQAGSLELSKVEAGRTELRVGSGNIDASSLKSDELIAEAKTGDIDMENVSGALHLNMSSGNADLKFAELTKNVNVQIGAGKITLDAPKSASFKIDGRTNVGDITVDFPNLKLTTQEEKRIVGEAGTGGVNVILEASKGDIEVNAH